MTARRGIRRGLVLAMIACAALGAGLEARSRRAAHACPEGTIEDEARGRAVLARLASVPEGRAIVARAPPPRAFCFGALARSVVTADGALWLDARLGEAEAAARAGHLLMHRGEPALDALDDPGPRDCAPLLQEALAAEARAVAAELALGRALGAARLEIPGADALAPQYAARCRAAKEFSTRKLEEER